MNRLKIGLIADPHYSTETQTGGRYPSRSLGRIEAAAEAFCGAGVKLILCLGDMINDDSGRGGCNEENLRRICRPLLLTGAECFLVQGNHDRELFTSEQLAELSGMTAAPFCAVRGGVRIITLDANYNTGGTPYRLRDIDWTDSLLPEDQLAFLHDSLAAGPEDAYIFIHQCLDPNAEAHHILRNASEVRSVINKSGKVRGVFQGHYHPGLESMVDSIPYRTLPAICEIGSWSITEF